MLVVVLLLLLVVVMLVDVGQLAEGRVGVLLAKLSPRRTHVVVEDLAAL